MSDIRVYLIGGPADGKTIMVLGENPPSTIYIAVQRTPTYFPDVDHIDPLDSSILQMAYEVRRMDLFGHRLFVGVPTGSTLEDNVKALFPAELAKLILEGPVLR